MIRRRVRSRESSAPEQSCEDETNGHCAALRLSVIQRVIHLPRGATCRRRLQRQHHSDAATQHSTQRSVTPTDV